MCFWSRMPIRDFQDLTCWRLSRELKLEVLAFTANAPASNDFKFCNQIRDSSASAPNNIAEGFGRFTPRDSAQFYRYAVASLMETKNHLIDAHDRKYIDQALYSRLMNLNRAALRATRNLMLSRLRKKRSPSEEKIKPSGSEIAKRSTAKP